MIISPFAFLIIGVSVVILLLASVVIIRKDNYGYLALSVCIYHLLFLLFPSLFHVAKNIFPFYGMSYGEGPQEKAAIVTLCFIFFLFFGFFLSSSYKGRREQRINYFVRKDKLFFALIVGFLAQFAVVAVYGVSSFTVSRADFAVDNFGESSSGAVAVIGFSRAVSFLCLFMTFYFRESFSRFGFRFCLVLAVFLFLIVNFPLSLPRFLMFSYVLAFLFVFTESSKRNKSLLFIGFGLGLTTVFPMLSYLTRGQGDGFLFDPIQYYMTSGDFDGFQSIINVVSYVEQEGHTFGRQLLGFFLFFVPRLWWSHKPVATGQVAAESAGYDLTNISAPLISELYIDFGFMGVTAGAALLGVLLRKLDSYASIARRSGNSVVVISCAVIFSFSLILQRGSLLGVISGVFVEVLLFFAFSRFVMVRRSVAEGS